MRFKFTVFIHLRMVFTPPSDFFFPQAIGCVSGVNLVNVINNLQHDLSSSCSYKATHDPYSMKI